MFIDSINVFDCHLSGVQSQSKLKLVTSQEGVKAHGIKRVALTSLSLIIESVFQVNGDP